MYIAKNASNDAWFCSLQHTDDRVCSSLMNYLDAHELITDNKPCIKAVAVPCNQPCTVIHDWSISIDQGLQTGAFILDFAKAFDSVPHERLKAKLNRNGINGKTLAWINNFLC